MAESAPACAMVRPAISVSLRPCASPCFERRRSSEHAVEARARSLGESELGTDRVLDSPAASPSTPPASRWRAPCRPRAPASAGHRRAPQARAHPFRVPERPPCRPSCRTLGARPQRPRRGRRTCTDPRRAPRGACARRSTRIVYPLCYMRAHGREQEEAHRSRPADSRAARSGGARPRGPAGCSASCRR